MSRTKRRLRKGAFIRFPRTLNELKAIGSSEEDGVAVRAKRNAAHIPNSYDDLHISATKQCCKWKRAMGEIRYFEVNVK